VNPEGSVAKRPVGCAIGNLRNGPAAERLGAIRFFGVECIEPQFDIDAFDADDEPFMHAARDQFKQARLSVWSVHAPFGLEVDLSSADTAIRARGTAAVKRAARGAAFLGAGVMVVHCGDLCGSDQDHQGPLERSREALSEILTACDGINVRIALENLPPGRLTCEAEELMSVVTAFPADRVGVCLDTGHANIAGTLNSLMDAVSSRIITVHLHDNDGSEDQHLVPGGGTIDWQMVRSALDSSPYDGPLMFEVDRPGAYAEMMVDVMKTAEWFAN